jgi:BirA family biotin operon repressor/biotin-[acetyl-CoA-carboxylase] ligase
LEIIFLKSVDSTHRYLKDYINKNKYKNPIAIVTSNQTNGIGSRDNSWDGKDGNLFFSFAIEKKLLPEDLPIQSSSIYFSYLLKEILSNLGSEVWLKWPNDYYINNKKIGGTITNIKGDILYCGIGLNLINTDNKYGYLDISVDINLLLKNYFNLIKSKKLWKHIFSKYSLEFHNSKQYNTTVKDQKISLKDSILNSDGSVSIENKKVFSLR